MNEAIKEIPILPGLDCGSCGFKTCNDLLDQLSEKPQLLERCIYHSSKEHVSKNNSPKPDALETPIFIQAQIHSSPCAAETALKNASSNSPIAWVDTLGREYDFILDHFPEDPGPREIILPHNPQLTREMEITVDDIIIGRPLGMSCGCPVTHCGIVTGVDQRSGVITWCITGPLAGRQQGFKDIGYYCAEAYEGIVHDRRVDFKIGMRYYFQPRRCMLQWRHSGLLNYLNKTGTSFQVRLEGLFIG